jgi:hypothetical protein
MATTKLIESTEVQAKEPVETDKDRYTRLLSSVQSKLLMMVNTPGSKAEFPEFVELGTFADKF